MTDTTTTCDESLTPDAGCHAANLNSGERSAMPLAAPSPSDHSRANVTSNGSTRKRGGAPSGNSNASTHGFRGSKFPKVAIREQNTVRGVVRATQAA